MGAREHERQRTQSCLRQGELLQKVEIELLDKTAKFNKVYTEAEEMIKAARPSELESTEQKVYTNIVGCLSGLHVQEFHRLERQGHRHRMCEENHSSCCCAK